MPSIIRVLKKSIISEGKLKKFILYTVLELFLVVFGILLALEIDSRNKENLEQKELNDLLVTISEEIEEDKLRLKEIQESRFYISKICNSVKPLFSKKSNEKFDISEVRLLLTAIIGAQNQITYQPFRSAYDVLKSSIYITKIKSKDLNKLLNSYYYNVDKLIQQETLFNLSLQKNIDDFKIALKQMPNNKDYDLNLSISSNINWEKVEERQSWYSDITNNSSTKVLLNKGVENTSFIEQYSNLITIGEQLIRMIKQKRDTLDEEAKIALDRIINIYDYKSNQLIVNGYLTRYFDYSFAFVEYFGQNLYPGDRDNAFVTIEYPQNDSDSNWAALQLTVSGTTGRIDLSKYKKLIIELKGHKGGENMDIVIKDILDPVDGSESRYNLEASNVWEKYEIDLKHFETADLNNVEVALGFVFVGKKERKIYVKNAYYQ